MKEFHKLCFFLFSFICTGLTCAAANFTLSGKITDEHGAVLPFVNVFIEGTSTGTTSNADGMYLISLSPGKYRIVFRMIGYRQRTEEVRLQDKAVVLNITLTAESYKLREVLVRPGDEDPAYAIIRKAIEKRKFHLEQVESFICNSYLKSTQMLDSVPRKIFGQKVELDNIIDSTSNIFYLSESVSELYFKRPDKVFEEMISSKVSGDPKAYSFNRAGELLISFYNNLISIGGLTSRGIVSPISPSAEFYYRFRYQGFYEENGRIVNKIEVIPRRKHDPVFSGEIYIVDDSWNIHSADLMITKNQQIEIIDTFRIVQQYVQLNESVWMPLSNHFVYSFGFLGFRGSGKVLIFFTDYRLQPEFPKGIFSGPVMQVREDANQKDSAYWVVQRPVELSESEKTDYVHKDSVRTVHNSKEYLDSIDHVRNKFKAENLFTGYSNSNSWDGYSWSISSPVENLQFNTVEGWNLSLLGEYRRKYGQDKRRLSLLPALRYGFSNRHWNASLASSYHYNRRKFSSVQFLGGQNVFQFNSDNPISEFVNSIYSLQARKNFMKIYEMKFLEIAHTSEIFNGVMLNLSGSYKDRYPLQNSSDYSLSSRNTREYLSNNPLDTEIQTPGFKRNNGFFLKVNVRITFKQKYVLYPGEKYVQGSDYPVLRISYMQGVRTNATASDFSYINLNVSDELRLGLSGSIRYSISAAGFLNKKDIYFMDYHHFNGNKTWFSKLRLTDFRGLDYYTYSTTSDLVEIHGEYNLGGLLLNKIPFIRRFKLNEVAGIHFFNIREGVSVTELNIGLEKFGFARVELHAPLENGKLGSIGFTAGIKRSIGFQ
ncbi:MAG: carboxypeptidase-like regulatory domain-containing protein [Bacteroidetes bacterium]|nr:MAG: carboxypeptidase-like regulatory domain-containing protein [Bacteroidota bacterium]REK08133.1 MAG: carboxypeptidase-like regulatory domain-containing protein [Bacteroidota bacterium]REK32338.1 MAG: carboxypeptidase-like regulatory domain-containing protein [Bacteroidota bacterium]REK49572.1 MAG: carboxypeptidase-like regulatory domain-containing protein [Bacteroidota bacterium]